MGVNRISFRPSFDADKEETFTGGRAIETFPTPDGMDLADGAEIKLGDKTYLYDKNEGKIVWIVDERMQVVGIENLEEVSE